MARFIIFVGGAVSVGTVLLLELWGFSIADLVFAIYGAQLGLFVPVLFTLTLDRAKLLRMGPMVKRGIIGGFIAGWGAAVVGRGIGNDSVVFLSPALSLLISCAFIAPAARSVWRS